MRAYDERTQLATLQYAMLAYLRHPPRGFDQLVRLHLSYQRGKILATIDRWSREAEEFRQQHGNSGLHSEFLGRLKALAAELKLQFAALEDPPTSHECPLNSNSGNGDQAQPSSTGTVANQARSAHPEDGIVEYESPSVARRQSDSSQTMGVLQDSQAAGRDLPEAGPGSGEPASRRVIDEDTAVDDILIAMTTISNSGDGGRALQQSDSSPVAAGGQRLTMSNSPASSKEDEDEDEDDSVRRSPTALNPDGGTGPKLRPCGLCRWKKRSCWGQKQGMAERGGGGGDGDGEAEGDLKTRSGC